MHYGIVEAEQYHHNSQLQMVRAVEAIDRFPWIGNERVLDVGCGDGKISHLLAEKLNDGIVIGFDVSPEMIQFASSNFRRHNLFFLEGNAQSIPFQNQFDIVVSFCCLHWIPNQILALQNIHRSLVPGGKTLFVIPSRAPSNLSPLIEKLLSHPRWAPLFPEWPRRINFSSVEEYGKLMETSGFTIRDAITGFNEIEFENRDKLSDWLRPLVPFTKRLSAPLQQQFLNELADELSSFCRSMPGGGLLFSSPKFEIVAQK